MSTDILFALGFITFIIGVITFIIGVASEKNSITIFGILIELIELTAIMMVIL